jgi:hypothetical protein
MPAKRTYTNTKRKVAKKYKTTVKKATVAVSTIQSMIKRTLYRNLEPKQSQKSSTDYRQIEHNSFINLDNAFFLVSPVFGEVK